MRCCTKGSTIDRFYDACRFTAVVFAEVYCVLASCMANNHGPIDNLEHHGHSREKGSATNAGAWGRDRADQLSKTTMGDHLRSLLTFMTFMRDYAFVFVVAAHTQVSSTLPSALLAH